MVEISISSWKTSSEALFLLGAGKDVTKDKDYEFVKALTAQHQIIREAVAAIYEIGKKLED